METSIELRYAGVVIGRATVAGEIDESSLFLPIPDPLPVGTTIAVKLDDRALEGRVIGVAESADPTKCGMRIQIVGAPATAASAPTASPPVPEVVAAPPPPTEAPPRTTDPVAEMPPEGSGAHADGPGDGVPVADETGGPSGSMGGRRKRRRR